MLGAQAFPGATFDFVELLAQAPQRPKPPGQADPQQRQQHQKGRAKAQVEIVPQPLQGHFVVAHRLQGDDAERRALTAEQLDLDVIDKKLLAVVFANARELVALAVIARRVVDVFFLGGLRPPDQSPLAIIDVAQQAGIGEVETLIGQLRWHLQAVAFHSGGGNQRGHVRGQALLDGFLQRQAERALHGWQQGQHEQHRQGHGSQHQPQAKRTNHWQRSLNR
ncbi:hypothetical protein D3C76_1037220 [compost metagenome]